MLKPYSSYAKAVGRKPSEIKRLIEKGRIAGVVHDDRVGYLVPEDALVNYAPRQKSSRSLTDHAFNLMRGLHSVQNVNHEILQLPRPQYESLIVSLIDKGLIRRDRPERAYDSGLALTSDGMELAAQKKRSFSRIYEATVRATAEGVVRGLVNP